ncbi:CD1108 family mobile element protein [Enterocloster clostridioformis]|uniref:NlpC/P60 family protein n=1 Tax=Enterocloster clostridioformis TaxID=1531 RepID=A0A1I0K1M4_9FIRM|nr:peptidoglycan DD-metalloendopeptidase family protein [Enterocloster clostridioformis]SEU16798.1 NlpC/P60 family protein [Enterocloster clostridioformis]SEW48235.1 NlpC/P60 family protein [Enterocloster clostridioformis]
MDHKKKSDFQPRDADRKKKKQRPSGNRTQKDTFGQNVQKTDGDRAEKPETAFSAGQETFSGQSEPRGEEKSERKQNSESDAGDYHRRDTYRPSRKTGNYYKKRAQRKRRGRNESKAEAVGEGFSQTRREESFVGTGKADFHKTEANADVSGSRKLRKRKRQAERAGRKLEKTRAKLPKEQDYTFQRVYDEQTGQARYELVPIIREKPFGQEGIAKTAIRRMQNEGRNFVHGKVSEVEKDNSGVEGAHKTEQKAEDAARFVRDRFAGREQRRRAKIAGLEKKQFQAEVNLQYQKFLEENPQMRRKFLQKRLRKRQIQKEYRKARQRGAAAKTAQETAAKSADAVGAAVRKIEKLLRKNAGVLVTVGVAGVLLVMVMTSVSSCGAMFADMQSTILAASYLSQPEEIDAADMQFTRLEMNLQNEIDHIETDHPGYDEYSYNLGEIGHDPFTLIGFLSAVHTEFTAGGVESEVQGIFKEMYTLTLMPDTETRTGTDSDGEEYEYEVTILRVTLTVKPLEAITAGKMNEEQREIYAMYGETKGLLQEFGSPLNLYWYNYISSYYGYRKNPNTGNEELHRGVDIAVPTGTVVYAAHDGIVTEAAYDSYYGNYVVIEQDGYTTKYAHLDSLNVRAGQVVRKGEQIGTTGNTGSSIGSHLHIECLYQGEYYNPLFYIDAGTETLYGEGAGGAGGNAIPPDSYDDEEVQALMEEAAKYLGFPYVWGGSSPSTSFDCSGFVCWVFSNSGVHNLPRTTAQGIYNQCTPVSASDAQAGDIIFFTGTYNSSGPVSHVGIYCGNGVMIHCGDPISYASVNSSYWQSHFYSYGRLN